MSHTPKRQGVNCLSNSGQEEPHALARRRQRKPAQVEDEPAPRSRHGLAMDASAWLTTLKGDATTPNAAAAPAAAFPVTVIPDDLAMLISALARRVAWGGDRRRGSARIELSDGPLAGATLVVHTEARAVSVELELPRSAPAVNDWRERIIRRLEERGFVAEVRLG